MKIKIASLDNLKEIKSLSKQFNFEVNRDWKELISSKNSKMFILIENNMIIGFSGLINFDWNNTIQISNVFIHPNYRGQGLGLELINYDIEQAKKTDFRCLIAEAPSLNSIKKLYEKAGFRKCGYNDRYYSNHESEVCIWMSYDLK